MKFLVENLNLFKQLGGADNTTVNIINVTSLSPDNHYNVNDSVSIQVVFSEAVFVTGKPQIELLVMIQEMVLILLFLFIQFRMVTLLVIWNIHHHMHFH